MASLVVFDCDGTLVDSQHAIVEAVQTAFRLADLAPPDAGAIRRIVGLSVPEALAALLPERNAADIPAMTESFREAFIAWRARHGHAHEPLFDGIREAIDALGRAGHKLAVATGKSRRGLEKTLGHHGLLDRFVSLQTADSHPSKPHPAMLEAAMAEVGVAPRETLLVGDTSYDMMMAKAAGTLAIGVAWGYHPADELAGYGADAIADRGAALPEIVARLCDRRVP